MTKIKFQLKNCENMKNVLGIFLGNFESMENGKQHFLDEFDSHQTTLDEYYDFVKNGSEVPLKGRSYENNNEVAKTIDLTYLTLKE